MVWSRISEGFEQILAHQVMDWTLPEIKRNRTPEIIMDFSNTKGSGSAGVDLTRDHLGLEKLYCPMCLYSI